MILHYMHMTISYANSEKNINKNCLSIGNTVTNNQITHTCYFVSYNGGQFTSEKTSQLNNKLLLFSKCIETAIITCILLMTQLSQWKHGWLLFPYRFKVIHIISFLNFKKVLQITTDNNISWKHLLKAKNFFHSDGFNHM